MNTSAPDFERYLLGHCLDDNAQFLEATELLRAEDFSLSAHQTIFRSIAFVLAGGQSADHTTVGQFLIKHSQVDAVGGIAYLSSLTEGLVRGRKNVRDYAEMVRESAQRRRLTALTERVASESILPTSDVEELIAKTENGLLDIRASSLRAGSSSVASAIVPLMNRLHHERKRKSDLLGLSCGVESLDVLTRGLQPGEVTVVGARSGVGKSSLMTQAAIANCKSGTPVMIFSVEMSRDQNLRRIFAAVASVSFPRVRDTRYANESDMQALSQASATVLEWPLHIIDESSITIEKLTASARLAVRREGVKLICVDYAQIVAATGRDERLRVAAVSRGLTRLAKDEGVPVMLLSQLARADRANPNRRPTMSDLRESSQLENDAHTIVLLHREWDEQEGRLSSDAEIIVAKQRSGETGVLPATFNKRSLFFEKRVAVAPQQLPQRQANIREIHA